MSEHKEELNIALITKDIRDNLLEFKKTSGIPYETFLARMILAREKRILSKVLEPLEKARDERGYAGHEIGVYHDVELAIKIIKEYTGEAAV